MLKSLRAVNVVGVDQEPGVLNLDRTRSSVISEAFSATSACSLASTCHNKTINMYCRSSS